MTAEDKLKLMIGELAFQVAAQTARAEEAERARDEALEAIKRLSGLLASVATPPSLSAIGEPVPPGSDDTIFARP